MITERAAESYNMLATGVECSFVTLTASASLSLREDAKLAG
jgi:hypothetical protein